MKLLTFALAGLFGVAPPLLAQPQPGTKRWSFDAGQTIMGSPALGLDGTVYIAALGNLFAITNSGSNKWTFPFAAGGNSDYGSPAVGPDDIIYLGGRNLHAVAPSGAEKWSYPTGGGNGSPALSQDGTIFVHGDVVLYAVSASGVLNWKYSIGGTYLFGSPVIAPSGSIYATAPQANAQTLYCLSEGGIERWRVPSAGESVAIAGDGTIYSTSGFGLQAISPDGTILWSGQLAATAGSSPAIASDGTIYVATSSTSPMGGYGFGLYAFSPDGSAKWHFATNIFNRFLERVRTPAIDSAGVIYYSSYGNLHAFEPGGTIRWTFSTGVSTSDENSISYTSPTIGPDGTIYCTFGTKLYAIAGTNGLANSPWPMYRGNARHTGRIEKPSLHKSGKRSDANFEFQVNSQVGKGVTVEASTNLQTWNSLTNFIPNEAYTPVVDLTASNSPAKFYRALSAP